VNTTGWVLALALCACDDGGGGGSQETAPGEIPEGRFVDYIRADQFSRLVFEVDAVAGAEPPAAVLDDLAAGLEPLLDKPGGIAPLTDQVLPADGTDRAWTFDELQALATSTFDAEVPDDTIKMHFLFVDGHFAEDQGDLRTAGLAWDYTHVVIFADTLDALCRAQPVRPDALPTFCAAVELGVLTHEVGHLLGLVNTGLPMVTPHEDPQHPGHDVNENCIMFWQYEGQGLAARLEQQMNDGEPGLGFDQACQDDIAAVRDAAP
jgi:hypothetical protein